MKARILDRWDMEVPEPSATDEWFIDWVHRSPKQAGQHLQCSYLTFQSILNVYDADEVTAVKEYFGGMGAHALMLEHLFNPSDHAVTDYSPDAVEHMQRVLPGGVRVWQADAYADSTPWPADVAVLDFGDLTVWKAQADKPHGKLLDRVFARDPLAVTITDIAARYLHLQKKHYEPILGAGTCETYESYLHAFARQIEERFGYSLLEGNFTRWSAVMSFVPSEFKPVHGDVWRLSEQSVPGLVLS